MILVPNEIAWLVLNIKPSTLPVFTIEEATISVAVAYAEAQGDTAAQNRKYPPNWDLGLFQISTKWHWAKLATYRWWDPFDNTRMMRLVHREFQQRDDTGGDGFLGWNTYRDGLHVQYMEMAALGVAHPWRPTNPDTTGWRTQIPISYPPPQ